MNSNFWEKIHSKDKELEDAYNALLDFEFPVKLIER